MDDSTAPCQSRPFLTLYIGAQMTNQTSDETSTTSVQEEGSDFSQWALSPEVLRAIADMKYDKATEVQAACIPHLLENQTDLLALAKTGTGKTAAFGLPLIERLSTDKKLQALVLCPTRELASQVAQNLSQFGKFKGIKVATLLGGVSYRTQLESLRNNPQIVVSTPGRLIDLLNQNKLNLASVETLILDEADEMLSFGFQEALETIWDQLSDHDVNTWLFSATMSESIKRLANKYLKDPHTVTLNTSAEPLRVDSFAAVVFEEDKEDALSLLIQNTPGFYGIIFAQTKQQVANLELRFRSMGLDVDSLHGDKVQAERTRTINRMKKREVQILVATDVAARGLDIQDLTHVVNFELPWDVETYTHRVGRTARAGKRGTVWTLVRPKESQYLRKFERALKFEFQSLTIPTVEDVRCLQIQRWLLDLAKVSVAEKDHDVYDVSMQELKSDDIPEMFPETKEWLIKAMKFMDVGSGYGLRQPRSFELRPRNETKRFEGGFRRENQDDRRDNRRGGPRRNFRRDDRGDRNDRGNDRFERSEGRGERNERRERPSTGDSRPARTGDRRERSGDSRPARAGERSGGRLFSKTEGKRPASRSKSRPDERRERSSWR